MLISPKARGLILTHFYVSIDKSFWHDSKSFSTAAVKAFSGMLSKNRISFYSTWQGPRTEHLLAQMDCEKRSAHHKLHDPRRRKDEKNELFHESS